MLRCPLEPPAFEVAAEWLAWLKAHTAAVGYLPQLEQPPLPHEGASDALMEADQAKATDDLGSADAPQMPSVELVDERTPHEVLPAYRERWAIFVWFHAEREPTNRGQDEEGSTSQMGGTSMMSFGNSVEEIKAFLFALKELNEAEQNERTRQPPCVDT